VTMCHADHPHDLTSPSTATHENNVYVDANNPTTRGSGSATRIGSGGTGIQNRAKTDFDNAATNGGMCISCHQKAVDANHPAIAKATFNSSAHNYTVNTVGGITYTWGYQLHDGSVGPPVVAFVRDCTKCHASSTEGTTPTVSANGSTTQAVHFSDTPSLLAGTTNPKGVTTNFICYNCHGSTTPPGLGVQGNRSGKDIQSQINHATTAGNSGHPANSDAVHNTVTESANAAFGNTLGVTGRHASCMDCHAPHDTKYGGRTYTTGTATVAASGTTVTGIGTQWSSYYVGAGFRLNTWTAGTWRTITAVGSATSLTLSAAVPSAGTSVAYTITSTTNLAGPSLQGAWGAQLSSNPAFFTAPATGNMTKTSITSGTSLEATLCFKCHSAFYGTLPTAPSSVGLPAPLAAGFTETDQAKEFNPANAGTWSPTWTNTKTAGSFHPVLANAGGNLGAITLTNLVTTNFPWSTTTRNVMSCSDCHESDVATDPNGPHGSAAKFILKGPNTLWNNTVALGNAPNYMPTNAFCANCHSTAFNGTRTAAHTNGQHTGATQGTCFMCHSAIPHGTMRPGLLSAPCGGPNGAGGTGTLATDLSPYSQSPIACSTGAGLYILNYPTNQSGTWGRTNCACGSSGSH
jgi:hypothetical protein